MPQSSSLRPATRCVLTHLLALGERVVGVTLTEIASALTLAVRTVRRALRELEDAGCVQCVRRSDKEKTVISVTAHMSVSAAHSGPQRPKTAPFSAAHSGPQRPKTAEAQSLLVNSSSTEAVAVNVAPTRAREASGDFEQQQQRQQLLDLGVSDDRDQRAVQAMLRRLDQACREVWRRVGSTHGYLALDEAALAGLGVAMRRYPAPEIVDCVVWSAERLAAGLLSPAYFATTFRGNAFCARHRDWNEALRASSRRARQEAAIAADVAAHRAPVGTALSGDELHARGLAALEQLAAGGP